MSNIPTASYLMACAGKNVRCSEYQAFGTPKLAESAYKDMRDRSDHEMENLVGKFKVYGRYRLIIICSTGGLTQYINGLLISKIFLKKDLQRKRKDVILLLVATSAASHIENEIWKEVMLQNTGRNRE